MTLFILLIAAFTAGFVDAIVGGGGLIQTPATLIQLQDFSVANVLGTVKIPSFTGTAIAFKQFLKKVAIQWKVVLPIALLCGISSYTGSYLVTVVDNQVLKPAIFIMLVAMFIYTIFKKNLGKEAISKFSGKQKLIIAISAAILIGVYDGFIGPGTGSLFVLVCVIFLGMDFTAASANSKICNLATNLGSIIIFGLKGLILFQYALPMAVANAVGGYFGSRLAIAKGNQFIRIIFLIVMGVTIARFGMEIF